MSKWISVEDKLPGNRRDVLTVFEEEVYWVGCYDNEKNKWFTFNPCRLDLSDEHTIDVDHWMELPSPPEENEE